MLMGNIRQCPLLRRWLVFRWDVVWHFLFQDPNLMFLNAAWITLWRSVVSQTCVVILGLFVALMRMSRFPRLSRVASAYTCCFRGTAECYGSQAFVIFELLIVATFYYLLLTTVWGYIQGWIENRLDPERVQTKIELEDKKGFAQRLIGFGGSRSGGTLVSGR